MHTPLLCLFTLSLLFNTKPAQAAIDIQFPGSNHQLIASVPLFYEGQPKNMTDLKVTGAVKTEIDNSAMGDLRGMVVFHEKGSEDMEPVLRSFQKQGAAAVVVVSFEPVPGSIMYFIDGSDRSNIFIPVVQILSDDFLTLKKNLAELSAQNDTETFSVNATVTFHEVNTWKEINESGFMIFWSVIIGGFGLFCVVEAARRLYLIIKETGLSRPLPVISLIFEIISNLMRVITSIDPQNSFKIYPATTSSAISLSTYFISVIPTILMIFFLHDAIISTKMKISKFFNERLRIPFFVALFLLVVLMIFGDVVIILNVHSNILGPMIFTVCTLLQVFLGIYFAVISRKMIVFMKKTRFSKVMHKTVIRVVVGLVGIFGECIFIFLLATPLMNYPVVFKVLFFFVYLFGETTSLSQIFAFSLKKSKSSFSTSKKSKKSKSHTEGGSGVNEPADE